MSADEYLEDLRQGDDELETIITEIRSAIGTIEENDIFYREKNFNSRADAIDHIEFHIIDRIDSLLQNAAPTAELTSLKQRAKQIKLQLEKINDNLFRRLRARIKTGDCRGEAFRDMVAEFVEDTLQEGSKETVIGYDNLDLFFDGLFPIETVPEETKEREAEMVFYQKTPARIIFELVAKSDFSKEDVFYDLGSGLGRVAILANLLSGVTTKGVEFEPAYCNYAGNLARRLKLPDVHFINADAREADYSDGTVFFMYTPFEGGLLDAVLEKLRLESKKRQIKLFTYGPCTLQVARQHWLTCKYPEEQHIYKLAIFETKN
jgi:hypothetical protein